MCDPRLLYPEEYGLDPNYIRSLPMVSSLSELTSEHPEGAYIIGTSGAGFFYHRPPDSAIEEMTLGDTDG